ncbi:SpoIID/LytB domain-containing protein [Mesobacillus maritimus]|uniref:SpoIID/LytB domain-containing protein n=1 Tax=Mesobacillus maritimus TaxID=1643336 RepID=UPI0020400D41|nr:SpoIID/LytB domain-containing protein [Mesobacillus maritimus]MCM3668101.1 SpoIID/LytB domain-containing protein [Mesobacillus maritimus]
MKGIKRGFLLLVIIMMVLPVITYVPVPAQASTVEPTLQVALKNYLGNTKEINLLPEVDYSTNLGTTKLEANQSYKLKINGEKLVLYKGTSEIGQAPTLELKPLQGNGPISINQRPYLGTFKIGIDGGNIRPINTIGLEDYLKGVVPAEMPALWSMEALKAQAVTARTYAMGYPNRVIDDTQGYQVYGGYTWHPRSTDAVDATTGQVIMYNGKAIGSAALFSSSNGGKTESNVNAWGSAPLPYLVIKADPYDPKTPWNFSVKKQQIDVAKLDLAKADAWWNSVKEAEQSAVINNMKTWLKANKYKGKDIKIAAVPTLSLHAPTSGGRVSKGSLTIEILVKEQNKAVLNSLEMVDYPAASIRTIIGTSLMKSFLVNKVDQTTDSITVSGAGYGHGIGLSQYGAKKAAELGKSYKEILAFYFDKTNVSKMYQVTPVEAEVQPDAAKVVPAPTPVEPTVAEPVVPAPKPIEPDADAAEPAVPTPTPAEPTPVPGESKPTNETVNTPAPAMDTVAPIIGAAKTTLDTKSNKVTLQFTTNEAGKVSVYVKDSQGKILTYLLNEVQKPAGSQTVTWDVSKVNNGSYNFGIIAIDANKNRGSALIAYKLSKPATPAKPVKKDTKAPTIKSIKTPFDSKKNQVKISFTTNEKAKITVAVKDSKGKVVTTLAKDSQKAAGTHSFVWNVSKVNNGKYSFIITAIDDSKNKGTASSTYSLNKPKPAPKKMTGKVKATTLNIRSTSSTKGKVIGTVKKNQTVTVLKKTGSWYQIQYGKKTGFVAAQYLTNVK